MQYGRLYLPEWEEDRASKRRLIIAFFLSFLLTGVVLFLMQDRIREAIIVEQYREIKLLEEKMKTKSKYLNPKLKRKLQKLQQKIQQKESQKQTQTAKGEGKGEGPGKGPGKINLNKPSLLTKTQSTNLPQPSVNLGAGPKLDVDVNINPQLLSQPSVQTEQLDVAVDLSSMDLSSIAETQAEIDLSDEGLSDVGVADVVVSVGPSGGASIEQILSQEAVPAISLGGGGIEGGGGGGLGIGADVGGGIGGGGGPSIELSESQIEVQPEINVQPTKPVVAPPPVASKAPVNPLQLEGEVANRPIVKKILPKYPKRARRMGWEGTVVLSFSVDENGNVYDIQVIHSSGYPDLDQAAISALRQWKFAPKPGKPEEKGRLTVRFTLT